MPDERKDVIHYTEYFNMKAPGTALQAILMLLLGVLAGACASFFIHYGLNLNLFLQGASWGLLVITLPGILTVIVIKAMKRRMQLKHAMFAVLAISFVYSLFIIFSAFAFSYLKNYTLAYVVLILGNAGVYGYWFFVNKVAIGQRKSAVFTAVTQPTLNILFLIPLGKYLFTFNTPVADTIIKLYFGMVVFLIMSYLILFLLDRPAKKMLNMSGVDIFSAMVSQWLYNFISDTNVFVGEGKKKDVNIEVLMLKGKKNFKAIFVKPDIHYGPFSSVGGSIAPEVIGDLISNKYKAAPFVVHGAVNIANNPMHSSQIHSMAKNINDCISKNEKNFRAARGGIGVGFQKPCRAIDIRIGDFSLLTLTKAPLVTEDIDSDIGLQFEGVARSMQNVSEVMLIDAHNSRFESASKEELNGINKNSKYIPMYELAIKKAMTGKGKSQLRFGASCQKISTLVKSPDIGPGYTSVGIFDFGRRRFGIIYLDANNIMPAFREELISHIKHEFKIDVELCTTDTHAVNTLALPASNALGRCITFSQISPIIDDLMKKALHDVETVNYSYANTVMEKFELWGEGAEEMLVKASRDIIYTTKRVVPLVIVAAFIIAAWIIYIV